MASLIPKIKVGLGANKREKHNLSFDCSTSANIGSVQPTMCREMAPKSKFKVKVSTLVRLASMPVPTFGRMSLRHYHTFVPCVDLWQPFDAMMSGQHYQGANVATFIPTQVPYFNMTPVMRYALNFSNVCIAPIDNIDKPYTITSTNVDWAGVVYPVGDGEGEYPTMNAAIRAAQAADLARIQTAWTAVRQSGYMFGNTGLSGLFTDGVGSGAADDYGQLILGDYSANVNSNTGTLKLAYLDDSSNANIFPSAASEYGSTTTITAEGADLITAHVRTNQAQDYYLLFKFKPVAKRLRTIFIGLGYQFSPYDTEDFSVLKLLAYYKAWWNLFCPTREKTFVDTNCYRLIKMLSDKNGVNASTGLGDSSFFRNFIDDLAKQCYYFLPQDYFSMSVLQPHNNNQDNSFIMNTGAIVRDTGVLPSQGEVTVKAQKTAIPTTVDANNASVTASYMTNPMAIRMALRLLTWTNKNTVIGRSVREYLKVHFGVTDVNAIDDGGVYRIGSSRTNVQISDVMSTAETAEASIGDYAGKGIGYGDSEEFDFTADKFGYWITLTAVVPESGYYQGYFKENRHLNRYQFFNPEFDAMGYQVLERGEVMDDYSCDSPTWKPNSDYKRTYAFGFVPRYSEYKVGRNIVNGDLSLVGLKASMAPYTLDRRISTGGIATTAINTNGSSVRGIVQPDFVPSVVYDNFRRIDPTDHLGQYNRIFNYALNDLDHFIIHNIFDVVGYLPMKSLSESFDTVAADDEGSIDVTHS